jgi:16S rRNA (guanine966-N2)-methyltransferase
MQGKRVQGKRSGPVDQPRDRKSTRTGAASLAKRGTATARNAQAPAQVRIIGGRWKRTPLPVADATGLRPTPDRVRETIFNWLAHFVPDLSEIQGLDMFAGTGALGFELASRGARSVTLVERNPLVLAALERSRTKLAADAVRIVKGDALAVTRSFADGSFDVIFLDPPFDAGLLPAALAASARLTGPGGLIYLEHRGDLSPDVAPTLGLTPLRAGRAGQVRFELLQRA